MKRALGKQALGTKALRVLNTAFLVLVFCVTSFTAVFAADLPLAAASPLTGVAFDDRPLLLPVQRNFQMAMLTAGSELGRSCGRMEAYGWRMSQTEQARVNQIFNNTADRLRLLGYSITPQTPSSVSKDITLFTADHNNKHFLFLWSAGELGLVLNICETSAPPVSTARPMVTSPSVQTFPVPNDVVPTGLDAASKHNAREVAGGFSPIGRWSGGYTCAQGFTGGTLRITELQGQNFEGVFEFYPTSKNPSVPAGSYNVYGQYDRESNRILINPGKWIKRPLGFYNTVIVGSFDPVRDGFSAYFQGISGCTSFEAHRADGAGNGDAYIYPTGKTHHVKKKKAEPKKTSIKPAAAAATSSAPTPSDTAPAPTAAQAVDAIPPAPAPMLPVGIPTPSTVPAPISTTTPAATAAPAPIATQPVSPPVALPPMPPVPVPSTSNTLAPPATATEGGILLAAPSAKQK